MKRLYTAVILITIMNLPVSCIFDECGDERPTESKVVEMATTVGTYKLNTFSDTESNNFATAAIQIYIADVEYSPISAINESPNKFTFATQAFACSPPEPMPTQNITTLTITSTEPVFSQGTKFEPGANLNQLFNVANENRISIDEYISLQNNDPYYFARMGGNIILRLNEAPDAPINQKLQIELKFDTAEVFQLETEIFKVE